MPRVLNETKHFLATSQIRELVNTLDAGECLPVASELVEKLSISHGTAIRAIKVLADEGIIYRPMGRQRYLVADRIERISARISMVRPDYPSCDLSSMTANVYQAGRNRNWKFNQHCFRSSAELDFVRIMGECDAMVLIPPAELITDEFVKLLLKPARPVVVLLQHLCHAQINNVCTNDFRVGELAVESLSEHGHHRILLIKDQPEETTMVERVRGFFSAAERLKLPYGGELYLDSMVRPFEDALDTVYRQLSWKLDAEKPDFTAVFTTSMAGGIAALRALREHGLAVPDDVAVLCFGGESDMAPYFHPQLSCIEIDQYKFGEYAAGLLEDALKRPSSPARQLEIEPRLVLRESI